MAATIPVSAQTQKAKAVKRTNSPAAAAYTTCLLPLPDGTWGYDVLVNGKLLIHQPSMPGMPGNSGFTGKATAGKVARLVIDKMKRGEMPPTVTVEELRELKAIQ